MASHFLLLARKKVTKEKGPHLAERCGKRPEATFETAWHIAPAKHSSTNLIKPGKDARSATLDAPPIQAISAVTSHLWSVSTQLGQIRALFFGYFLLSQQKKVTRHGRANSGRRLT